MKTAQELYKISKTKAPEIVDEILKGVKEHVIQKCEEEACKAQLIIKSFWLMDYVMLKIYYSKSA